MGSVEAMKQGSKDRYFQDVEEDFKKLGKEILTNHFKNEKIRYSETNVINVLNNFKLKKIDELYKLIGNGTILPSKII